MTSSTSNKPAAIQPAPHNHTHCIRQAIRQAEQLCIERGVQLTAIRHRVLELIWDNHKAVKAYDLLDRLKAEMDAAKPATVYRALDFLIEQGLIHRIESLNAFIGCPRSDHRHDQLLLICDVCQDVEERPATGVMQALMSDVVDSGFQMQNKIIEIHGRCARCTG